jgi:hypothetical protein
MIADAEGISCAAVPAIAQLALARAANTDTHIPIMEPRRISIPGVESNFECKACQTRHAVDTKFAHETLTMRFDCTPADAQLRRDGLVCQPTRNAAEYIAFPRCELVELAAG